MKISVDVEGFESIADALTRAGENLIPCATRGMRTGLHAVERDAKALCVVNTGELRNSIRTEVSESSSFVVGKVVAPKDYAVYVEMGTGEVGKKSGGNGSDVKVSYRTGGWFVPLPRGEVTIGSTVVEGESAGFMTWGQPARPFLYPAFKANKKKVLAAIRGEIRGGLADACGQSRA